MAIGWYPTHCQCTLFANCCRGYFLPRLGRQIVFLKFRHISMQLTRYIPTASEVADDAIAVLDDMGIDKVDVGGA